MISTLQRSISASFSSLPTLLSPVVKILSKLQNRMTLNKIKSNSLKNLASTKFVNNIRIIGNCTAIVLRYSKCYLCKFPLINKVLRLTNQMQFLDSKISSTNDRIFSGVFFSVIKFHEKLSFLRKIRKYFNYKNKNVFSAFSLLFTDSFTQQQQQKALKYLSAVQSITLGFQLHRNVGSKYRPNKLIEIGLKILQKDVKDKHLVLAGDYFHIKASVLGAETKNINISKLLAEMEINLCKCIYLQEQLNKKINQNGYKQIPLEMIHQINSLQAKRIVQSLIGLDLVKGRDTENSQQLYSCIGLMILYQKELENFMLNIFRIFNNYLQHTKRIKINFCEDYNLINYLFYQSAQQNDRIDLAYVNAVQLMIKQIQFLEGRLSVLVGNQEKEKRIMKKVNYILMFHSYS